MGVTETGVREVLGLLVAPSENFDSWCTMLSTSRARGHCMDRLRLVVSDGREGDVPEKLRLLRRRIRRTRQTTSAEPRGPELPC